VTRFLRKLRNKKVAYPLVFLCGAILLFFAFGILKSPLNLLLRLPLEAVSLLKREAGALVFFHYNDRQRELLQKENSLLRYRLNILDEAYLENQRLKKLLSFKRDSPFKVVPCRVIGRSADNWGSSILIDKGRSSGLRRGMPVVTYDCLVGRIAEVYQSSANVLLVSDPSFSVSALSQRSRQEGLVCGTLGSFLIMKYLPDNADIRTGDLILTSGLNEVFPKGIAIGKVVSIGKELSGLSSYCLIRPERDLSRVEEVLVVDK
jgi:rod shape-determining protein MreC